METKEELNKEILKALRSRLEGDKGLPVGGDFERRVMRSLPMATVVEDTPSLFNRIAYLLCPLSLGASALMLVFSLRIDAQIKTEIQKVDLVSLYLMDQ